jgi:hypothetical protein
MEFKQEKEGRRNQVIVGIVGNLVGMAFVASAFRMRWWPSDPYEAHPFPIQLGIGAVVVFGSTTLLVRGIVETMRARKRRGD